MSDNIIIMQIPHKAFGRVPARGYGKKKLYYTGSLADLWEEGYKYGANTALTKEAEYLKIYQNAGDSQGFWVTPVNFDNWDTAWIDQTFTAGNDTYCNIYFAVGAKSDPRTTADRKLDFYRLTDGERRKIPFHVAGLGQRYLRVGSYNNYFGAQAITQQIHNVYLTAIQRLNPDSDGFIYKPGTYEYNWTVRNNDSPDKRIHFGASRIEIGGAKAYGKAAIASAKPITPSEWDGISIDWDVSGAANTYIYNRFGVGAIDAAPANFSRFAHIPGPIARCTQRVPLTGLAGNPHICVGNYNTYDSYYARSALIYGIRLYRVPDNIVGALGLGAGQLLWDGVGDDLWGVNVQTAGTSDYVVRFQGDTHWTLRSKQTNNAKTSMITVKPVDLSQWSTLHVLWEQTYSSSNIKSALAVGTFGHDYNGWTAATIKNGAFTLSESTLDVSSITSSLHIAIHSTVTDAWSEPVLRVKRVWLT